MIELANVKFGYSHESYIYKDFSIRMCGSFFGLIGVNGAGKSTLLKLCLGHRFPESGEILLNDFCVGGHDRCAGAGRSSSRESQVPAMG